MLTPIALPLTITFIRSGTTPVREYKADLKIRGASSVLHSISLNFSFPHFTFTEIRKEFISCCIQGLISIQLNLFNCNCICKS